MTLHCNLDPSLEVKPVPQYKGLLDRFFTHLALVASGADMGVVAVVSDAVLVDLDGVGVTLGVVTLVNEVFEQSL